MITLNLFFLGGYMNFSNYLGKEKMKNEDFIDTYIERLSNLLQSDLDWALHYNEQNENESVQDLLMEMVFSFYATDLVIMKDYEKMLCLEKEIKDMNCLELQAYLIHIFHQDRVIEGSLIVNGIGHHQLLDVLCQLKIKLYN